MIIQKKAYIKNEATILNKLKGISEVPFFYEYKILMGKNILCESLFGSSLEKIHIVTNSPFDIMTLSIIGIQIINILEKIHGRNIIHSDINQTIFFGKNL